MPCFDGGPSYSYSDDSALRSRNTHLAQMLCVACKYLEFKKIVIPTEIREWWTEHKRQDEARIKQEKIAENKRIWKEKILKQFTPEQKEILGIRE